MLVRQQPRWRGFRRGRRQRVILGERRCGPVSVGRAEGEMAVIALVQRFDQIEAGSSERSVDLAMAHARPARNVDGAAVEVIAVRNSADCPIVLWRAVRARDHAIGGRQPNGAGCVGRARRLALLGGGGRSGVAFRFSPEAPMNKLCRRRLLKLSVAAAGGTAAEMVRQLAAMLPPAPASSTD